jgi:hypothetical protein
MKEYANMSTQHKAPRCRAKTKTGTPCRAAAMGGGLCFFHANPDKASELGRIGGRRNRHAANATADPPPALDTAMAVRDAVARLIAEVYAGTVSPRTAASLTPLLNLQMHAIETTDLEQRVAKVEKLLAKKTMEAEERLNGKPKPTEDLVNSARGNALSMRGAPEPPTKEVAKW